MFVLYICCVIGVVVFGAMGYSMYTHRKSQGAVAAQFHDNTRLEVLWTIIPAVILVGMAYPATVTLIKMYDTGGEDLIVEVRGYQWKWQYKYLDEDHKNTLSYFSTLATTQDEIHNKSAKGEYYLLEVDKPLVIPTKKKVRFLITGNDVIHSFCGAGLRASSVMPCPASSTTCGQSSTSPASIAVSAPSCAARITGSCRSSCNAVPRG